MERERKVEGGKKEGGKKGGGRRGDGSEEERLATYQTLM